MSFFYMTIIPQEVRSGAGVVFTGSKHGENAPSEEESIGN